MDHAPESIRLFWLCENMKWNHLPIAGGLYDQHPRLLQEWAVIFDAKNRREREELAKQQAQVRSSRAGKRGRR